MPGLLDDILKPANSGNGITPPTPEYRPLLGMATSKGFNIYEPGLINTSAPKTFADKAIPYQTYNPYETDFFSFRSSGDYEDLGYSYGSRANQDAYYQKQSVGEGLGNAFIRLGITAWDAFLNNFAQYARDIDYIKGNKADSLWNSDFNAEAHDTVTELFHKYPIYSPSGSEDSFKRWLPGAQGSLGAYGDLIGQLGFTAGTIGAAAVENMVIGLVTEGAGLSVTAPKAAKNIYSSIYQLSKLFNNERKFAQALNAVKGGKDILNYSGSALKTGVNFYQMYHTAASEAAFEAMAGYTEHKQQLIDEYIERYGYAPQGADLAAIESNAKSVGDARFGANTAVLMTSNAMVWGNIIKPFKSSLKTLEDAASLGKKIEFDAIKGLYAAKEIPKAATSNWWLSKIKGSVLGFGGSLSEGLEESMQNWIDISTKDYFKAKYDNPEETQRADWLSSLGTGFSHTFGTAEGWQNFIAGALTGVITGGVAYPFKNRVNKKDEAARVNAAVASLNSLNVKDIFNPEFGGLNAQMDIKESLFEATAADDIYTFKNLKEDAFRDFILTAVHTGKLDARIQQLEDFKNLPSDQFQQVFGIDPSTENVEAASSYIDNLISTAKQIEKDVDFLNRKFKNPYNPAQYKRNTPEWQEEALKHFAYNETKNIAAGLLDRIRQASRRAESIITESSKINKQISSADFTSLADTAKRRESIKNLKEFSKALRPGDSAVEVKANRRKLTALKAYDELVKALNKYILSGNATTEGIEKITNSMSRASDLYFASVHSEKKRSPLTTRFEKYLDKLTEKLEKYFEPSKDDPYYRENVMSEINEIKPNHFVDNIQLEDYFTEAVDYMKLESDSAGYTSLINYLIDPDNFEEVAAHTLKALQEIKAEKEKRAEAVANPPVTPEQEILDDILNDEAEIAATGVMGQAVIDGVKSGRGEEVISMLRDQASNPVSLTALLGKTIADKIIALGPTTPAPTQVAPTPSQAPAPQQAPVQAPAPQVQQQAPAPKPQAKPQTPVSKEGDPNTPGTLAFLRKKLQEYDGHYTGLMDYMDSFNPTTVQYNALQDDLLKKSNELEAKAKQPNKKAAYNFKGLKIFPGLPIVISVKNLIFAGNVTSDYPITTSKGDYIQVKTEDGKVYNIYDVQSIKAKGKEEVEQFMALQQQTPQGSDQAKENIDLNTDLLKDTERMQQLIDEAKNQSMADLENEFLNNDTTC